MCIIFYNPDGTKYDKRELRNAADHNDDGAGIMWVEDGKVKVHHEMVKSGEQLIKMMKDFEGRPHMLHLRYATHGQPSIELCHPFKATPDEGSEQAVWLMHNGVIKDYAKKASTKESDTLVFSRTLQQVVKGYGSTDILFHEKYVKHLESVIDADRMIFLRDDGKVQVLNPAKWFQDEKTNIWYSNMYSLKDIPSYKKYTSSSYYSNGYSGYTGRYSSDSYGSHYGYGDWDDRFGKDDDDKKYGSVGKNISTGQQTTIIGPVNKPARKIVKETRRYVNSGVYVERQYDDGSKEYVRDDKASQELEAGRQAAAGKSASESAKVFEEAIRAEESRAASLLASEKVDTMATTRPGLGTDCEPATASADDDTFVEGVIVETEVDVEEADEDSVFYFKWDESGEPVFCDEEEADFEVDEDEFYEMMEEQGLKDSEDEEKIQVAIANFLRGYHLEDVNDIDAKVYNYDSHRRLDEIIDEHQGREQVIQDDC